MLLVVLCLLVVSAARPAWEERTIPEVSAGRDIVILFDTSRSMLCTDVSPSRLEHAKWLTHEIVRNNQGDRFSLIAFAGKSLLICPLTADQAGFNYALQGLNTDTIGLMGTNLESAVKDALRSFESADGNHRAVLLVTDGDELEGNVENALSSLVSKGIPVLVAGIGDPVNPGIIQVPSEDGSGNVILKDKNGKVVQSRLNETLLISVAEKTGGMYVQSTSVQPNLDSLNRKIRSLVPEEAGTLQNMTRMLEQPRWPLCFAFAILCIWFILGERRRVQ